MGDPACFLSRVCLSCGRDLGGPTDERSVCPNCGRRVDGSLVAQPLLADVRRSNIILYCRSWHASVAFYRDQLGLESTFAIDWFVEFRLTNQSALSVADAARATIEPAGGAGITLSLEVTDDLESLHTRMTSNGLRPGDITVRFGSRVFDIWDPEGHRIELWSAGSR